MIRPFSLGLLIWLLAMLLSACAIPGASPDASQAGPAPTALIVFGPGGAEAGGVEESGLPTVSGPFAPVTPQPTSSPTGQPAPASAGAASGSEPAANRYLRVTLTPTPAPQRTAPARPAGNPSTDLLSGDPHYRLAYVYQEGLAPGWTADDSWGVDFDLEQKDVVHDGRSGVVVTPVEDFGALFFHLEEGAEPVLRADVAAVYFWINPGENQPFPDDLAVTVTGSNAYPHWVEGDTSVDIDNETRFFSETRLSMLGFNTQMQSGSWYPVTLWLDDLPYDPDYTYLTGLYIKNDAGFNDTFYIDDVSLIKYAE